MLMTPSSFTYEFLSSLKFKELQKLSVQFHVNKRWAKKHELIENLLALKEKDEVTTANKQEGEKEWSDGSTMFSDSNQNNENEMNRRLTFNVSTKPNTENTDSRLTFDVPQNDKNLLGETINSRETYDVPPSKTDLGVKPLLEPRATFDIPPNKKLIDDVDPRATFEISQNERKFLEESDTNLNSNSYKAKSNNKNSKDGFGLNMEKVNDLDFKQGLRKIKFDLNVKSGKEEKNEKAKSQIKTLTIPYARVTRRTKLEEASKTDDSPIKMSKKSINIKKSTRIPISTSDLIKSPALSSIKNSANKKNVIHSLTKMQSTRVIQNKVPVRLQFTEEKPKTVEKLDSSKKENVQKILRRRILKTKDEAFTKQLNLGRVNFRTPPSLTNSSKVLPLKKTPLREDNTGKLNSGAAQTPGNKLTTKPIAITKMPDFSKIHKRQFEQMDSLHDYLRKKEERVRKLFGTPQPGQQLHALNKSAPVFHFQSSVVETGNKESETSKSMATPLKKKENNSKAAKKEAFKCKLPPSSLRSDIKDKNRSHIHGVRTNKRFELQMKFRNI